MTIYVPDDLAEEVRSQKDTLNISQVCSQALRAEVRRLKATEEMDPMVDLAALTERLKAQKQNSMARCKEAGKAAAVAWLLDAPYDAIQEQATPVEVEREVGTGGLTTTRMFMELPDLPAREKSKRARFLGELAGEGLRPEGDAYSHAWQTIVKQTWEAVKAQLD